MPVPNHNPAKPPQNDVYMIMRNLIKEIVSRTKKYSNSEINENTQASEYNKNDKGCQIILLGMSVEKSASKTKQKASTKS